MSTTVPQSNDPGASTQPSDGARPSRWQFGLRTVFLLMAAIAVWMTYFINRRENALLEQRIKAMVPLAHELVIDDPGRVAVVKLDEKWYDENRWEIYLPPGAYRLCLATRGINDSGLAQVMKTAPIAPVSITWPSSNGSTATTQSGGSAPCGTKTG